MTVKLSAHLQLVSRSRREELIMNRNFSATEENRGNKLCSWELMFFPEVDGIVAFKSTRSSFVSERMDFGQIRIIPAGKY
jgi:hypothetical protein